MSWFQRKRNRPTGTQSQTEPDTDADPDVDTDADPDAETGEQEDPASADGGATGSATTASSGDSAAALEERRLAEGPRDESEVDDTVTRVDLGAIRLPARERMELRLEVEDATKRVIAVTVTMAGSSVQLQAFAAPRRDGLWDDIRGDIVTQITKQGGSADEVPGRFGREIIARLPIRTADGRTGHRASRFVGIDGPRWFLRGVFTGPAAVDVDAAGELEEVVRAAVVVRGSEAMAPRDLLALKLPAGAQGAPTSQPVAPPDVPERDPLAPFERGPEITERR